MLKDQNNLEYCCIKLNEIKLENSIKKLSINFPYASNTLLNTYGSEKNPNRNWKIFQIGWKCYTLKHVGHRQNMTGGKFKSLNATVRREKGYFLMN